MMRLFSFIVMIAVCL